MPLAASETSPLIMQARSVARQANPTDLKWVEPGTLVIDTKIGSLPKWYKEPRSKPVPQGYQEAYRAKVPMTGVKFHVAGRGADYYQGINMAEIQYCFTAGTDAGHSDGKPVVIITNGDGKMVEIPLGEQHRSLIIALATSELQIRQAMSKDEPDKEAANQAIRNQREAIAQNKLVTGILEELGSGTTIDNVVLKVAGGVLK